MKSLTLALLILLFGLIQFNCDDENEVPINKEDHTTFSARDSLVEPFWLEMFPKVRMQDTVECNTETYLSVMDSLVHTMTYIIKDMCQGNNSSFVERPDEFREIEDVIKDGKTFVGTYPNNFASRYLLCNGEGGTGCVYTIITDRNFTTARDSLVQDTLGCNERNQIIYVNATNGDITIKVTILEKCQNGTLDIIVRERNYTPLIHTYRVNQTPSTTKIKVRKNSFIQLHSFGSGGRVVYKLGFG